MVTFVSLFLGLVLGVQTVAVQVAEPVARVDLLLDGKLTMTLDSPPWEGQIDLGQDLEPHQLVAVAYDESQTELDRVTQWINLPRPPAEVTILLDRDEAGQAVRARVSWESLVDDEPSAVLVELDGSPLDPTDPLDIPLPRHDPEVLHLLRAEVEFGGIVRANAEITFGGSYMDQINSELTAIPIQLSRRRKPRAAADLQGWFVARQKPLRVAAMVKGQLDLLVVRDSNAWPLLRQIYYDAQRLPPADAGGRSQGSSARTAWFAPDMVEFSSWTYQFFWPIPRRRIVGENPYDLFTHSRMYAGNTGSLHGWLTALEQPEDSLGDQRLADAVAVAGVTAAGGNRRRAVLLVLGPEAEDASEATPAAVRRYLAALGVPLFVWSPEPTTVQDSPWGNVQLVSTPALMSRATNQIFHELERQRIVWVEGKHLPQQVLLTDAARGLETVAQVPPAPEDRK